MSSPRKRKLTDLENRDSEYYVSQSPKRIKLSHKFNSTPTNHEQSIQINSNQNESDLSKIQLDELIEPLTINHKINENQENHEDSTNKNDLISFKLNSEIKSFDNNNTNNIIDTNNNNHNKKNQNNINLKSQSSPKKIAKSSKSPKSPKSPKNLKLPWLKNNECKVVKHRMINNRYQFLVQKLKKNKTSSRISTLRTREKWLNCRDIKHLDSYKNYLKFINITHQDANDTVWDVEEI